MDVAGCDVLGEKGEKLHCQTVFFIFFFYGKTIENQFKE